MSNIYLFNHHVYFNRIITKYDTILEYGTPLKVITNVNFYAKDGVMTEHIVNNDTGEFGNYFIVTDNDDNIKSRWYIMDETYTRGKQVNLTLKRDILADFYDLIITSPSIIHRAMLNSDNPLLFNSEGFSFNQIKKNEILLNDSYDSRWIYLYMAKNAPDKSGITVNYNPFQAGFDYTINAINNSIFDGSEHKSYSLRDSTAVEIYAEYWCEYDGFKYYQYKKTFNDYSALLNTSNSYNLRIKFPGWNYYPSTITSNMKKAVKMNDTLRAALINDYHNYLGVGNYITQEQETILENCLDKVIYEQSTGKYFKVTNVEITNRQIEIKNSLSYNFCNVLTSQLEDYFYNGTLPDSNTYNAELEYKEYKVTLIEIEDMSFSIDVSFSTHAQTDDSECNIIALPLEGFIVQTSEDDPETGTYSYTDIRGYEEINLAVARSIAKEYGKDFVYDMQILPYGPFPTAWTHAGEIDITKMNSKNYQALVNPLKYYSYLFYLSQSNLTFDIGKVININNYTDNEALNKKISNECDVYRLCSPNYNGVFEFSIAKNNGVTKFNVDMTLRPFNPYIHINPDFKGLYGDDFNDSRGLILGGDFSIPIISDAFINYELQNKNYQIAFDRQISHMEYENKLARKESLFTATMGTIQGTLGGTSAGAITSGTTAGAIVGGIGGAIASGIGGAMDYSFLKKRQAENKDLAIDMFNYNLGNIKALPYSLTKVNPITYNNKKFPFIEVYESTNQEKDILINKIKYNSMTVEAIGTVEEYIKEDLTFIKATLIRLEGAENLSNHEVEEIYSELEKGVYI